MTRSATRMYPLGGDTAAIPVGIPVGDARSPCLAPKGVELCCRERNGDISKHAFGATIAPESTKSLSRMGSLRDRCPSSEWREDSRDLASFERRLHPNRLRAMLDQGRRGDRNRSCVLIALRIPEQGPLPDKATAASGLVAARSLGNGQPGIARPRRTAGRARARSSQAATLVCASAPISLPRPDSIRAFIHPMSEMSAIE